MDNLRLFALLFSFTILSFLRSFCWRRFRLFPSPIGRSNEREEASAPDLPVFLRLERIYRFGIVALACLPKHPCRPLGLPRWLSLPGPLTIFAISLTDLTPTCLLGCLLRALLQLDNRSLHDSTLCRARIFIHNLARGFPLRHFCERSGACRKERSVPRRVKT